MSVVEASEAVGEEAVKDGAGRYVFSPSLVTLAAPSGVSAESVRAVRTHIVTQHLNLGRRALAICSPNLGAGSTFLATNLAVSLAQIGLKVLLVDGDLRDPGVGRLITPPQSGPGLAGCLQGSHAAVGDFIDSDVLPNLSVLYAGAPTQSSQELLATHGFEDVMNVCLRNYDVTIIDTPPANTCADFRRICSVVGFALVVARRHKSLVPDVKALCRELVSDDTTVLGTVLND